MVIHNRSRRYRARRHPIRTETTRPAAGRGAAGTALLLIVAAVTYSGWMLEVVLPTGLSPVVSFVSEHYPLSQPYQEIFRAADIIAGTLYTVAALGLARLVPASAAGGLVVAGVGVFGVATVADAVFVPDCVATVDRACERRELSGRVSWHHLLHLASSALTQFAMFAVVLALLGLAFRWGGRVDRWQAAAFAGGLAVTGLGCVALYELRWAGVAQRLQLVVIAAGTVIGAMRLLSVGRQARRPYPRHRLDTKGA